MEKHYWDMEVAIYYTLPRDYQETLALWKPTLDVTGPDSESQRRVRAEAVPEPDEDKSDEEEVVVVVPVVDNVGRDQEIGSCNGTDHGEDHGTDPGDDHGNDHSDDHGNDHSDDHGIELPIRKTGRVS